MTYEAFVNAKDIFPVSNLLEDFLGELLLPGLGSGRDVRRD